MTPIKRPTPLVSPTIAKPGTMSPPPKPPRPR